MRTAEIEDAAERQDEIQDESEVVSLCSFYAGSGVFGIDTRKICEVLGERDLHCVPMAPAFVAGIVPYRGDVLTTVNFRALLGLGERAGRSCVLVLEDDEAGERFGLVVDGVGGVVMLNRDMLEANPCTLEPRERWLFDGAYKMRTGLMVQLDPLRLRPSRLAETGLFRQRVNGGADEGTDRR
jgi:purine-binding chemotaxis protein CheW